MCWPYPSSSILAISLSFLWHFTSAVSFNIDLWYNRYVLSDSLFKEKISPIYFTDHWNDFWWFIYFGKLYWSGYEIEGIWSTGYECSVKAWWFYYNAERWDRLWPLDAETAQNWWMEDTDVVTGGIYTRCRLSWYNEALIKCGERDNEDELKECQRQVNELYSDSHWYFGKVEHVYSWWRMWLVMGTDYSVNSWWVVATWWLAPSLIRISNQY